MWYCLAHLRPLDPSDGSRKDIYVASHSERAITGMNGVRWEPAMVKLPEMGIRLFNGSLESAVSPGGTRFDLGMEMLRQSYPAIDGYSWGGAKVTFYAGKIGTAWPWQMAFEGRIDGYGRDKQTLSLQCSVDTEPFAKDVLNAAYAGTGAEEGGADLKNRVKPLVIGRARNVEPVLINVVDSVYQFSAYGPIEAVTGLFERGSDFGAADADYADYASLVAADIDPGKWATCLNEGLVRLGAPAYGVITGDIMGHEVSGSTPRLTGEVIEALADIAGVSATLLETASLAALDTAVPYNINLVLTDQVQFFDIARNLALPCNYQAGISLLGKFFVAAVDFGASETLTLHAQGKRLPQVTESSEGDVSPPYYRTVLGADRSWRVHTLDEISFYAELIERGLYDAATVYREGNIVSTEDGSRWLYINPSPTSGNTPETGSAYWAELSGELGISTERYPNGPPGSPNIGSLYFNQANQPFRWEGGTLTFEDDPITLAGDPWLFPGWVSVRDKALGEVVDDLQALDNDAVLTAFEKKSVAIPGNRRLESEYDTLLALAASQNLTIPDATAAWNAWVEERDSLVPAWNDISQASPYTRSTWDSVLDTLETELNEARSALDSLSAVNIVPPPAQTVEVDSDGEPATGQFPRTLTPTIKRGAADIRTATEVSYAITATGDIVAAVSNAGETKGQITVTDGTEGTIELTVTVSDIPFPAMTITFVPVLAAEFAENSSGYAIIQRAGTRRFCNQWGRLTIPGNSNGTITFPFPMKDGGSDAQPSCVVNGGPSSTSNSANLRVIGVTGTGATVVNNDGATQDGFWVAMGELA